MRFKLLVIALLILSVAGVAGFGFATMLGHGDFEHSGCLAVLSGTAPCPESTNPFDYTTFHLELLRAFSSKLEQAGNSAILIFLAIVLFGLWIEFSRLLNPKLLAIYYRYKTNNLSYLVTKRQLRLCRWLALHEARDPGNSLTGALIFSRPSP